ncbi:Hypothetical protein NTJ_06924 [Nesidiocoris tenuis]|uniref:Uncharacterized protein n=1 Tax=Nesidiocoris tenuis TaxID=355587 RepID=A0ABN7APG7_9HEMI|nr:Hypothetical protein NTJ_06924 [Nesidiocoris tenuis]
MREAMEKAENCLATFAWNVDPSFAVTIERHPNCRNRRQRQLQGCVRGGEKVMKFWVAFLSVGDFGKI